MNDTLQEAQDALHRARQLQKYRQLYGVDGIRFLVSDVDGAWLETWEATPRDLTTRI